MNSVPKESKNYGVGSHQLPIKIEQYHFYDGINNFHFDINYDTPFKSNEYATSLFRVYPKGENPMSKQRENDKYLL